MAYPNPATDELFIRFQGMALEQGRLSVFDAQGKLVTVLRVNNGSVSISALSMGMYAAKVQNSTGRELGVVRFNIVH